MNTYVLLGVIAIFAIVVITVYNGLVQLRNKVEEAFSTMDVFLKKRFELVPNLVAVVKGYASHETVTLEKLTNQRLLARGREGKLMIDENITTALANIMVVAEAYPDLKASKNFLDLQNELSKIEEDIASSRRYYNGSVREYNNKCQSFPSNLIAKIFKFDTMQMFQVEAVERQNVNVSF